MRKKYILGTTAVILAVLLPLVFFLSITASVPPVYGETFVQALGEKFDRLTSVDEPKLILIGGSSVAFGFDSKMLEEALGMPVVNFGLYATLGTKLMMDLSKANIGKNDIILLSPEMDPQTLSLYFNADSTWQAMEGHTEMLRYIAKENLPAMAGAYYEYGMQKFGYHKDGIKLSPTGVYRSDSFNAYGDIAYKRPYNTLYESTGLRYDTTTVINLTPEIVSDDFIDYVNEYTAWCKKKGATVYFSFCPMNRDALSQTTDAETMIAFFDYLSASLECTVIGSPEDTAYDAEYFYDTNYHLNDAGAILHTKEILKALYRQLGRTDLPRVRVPEKPSLPVYEGFLTWNDNEYSHFFLYEAYGNGYAIVGTTDAAQSEPYLEIPTIYKGRAVLAIASGAFAGCDSLSEIKIFKNVTVFEEELFSGYSGNLTVYMDVEDAAYMTDPNASLPRVSPAMMENTTAKVKICFSQKCFERYLQDYSWQQYGALFDVSTKESPVSP
ncbi:MAG: hypothetical protein IKB87_04240 [Clostridia bacterium]|nr:hypothetical protein [Clostridia bacterium]